MAASTTFLGRQFQSLIVLGRKEELLLPVLCPCWDELELPVVTSVLARGEGDELEFEAGTMD